jgi:hypothetical protein
MRGFGVHEPFTASPRQCVRMFAGIVGEFHLHHQLPRQLSQFRVACALEALHGITGFGDRADKSLSGGLSILR